MVRKYDIEFIETSVPIKEPVTKFGGQPVWIEEPAWPLSRKTGEQMQFICQVSLDPELLGVPPGKMAYLFMTGSAEGEWVDGTHDPDGGENALIVQPSAKAAYGGRIEIIPSATGPTLYRFEEEANGGLTEVTACEYAVNLTPGEELSPFSHTGQGAWSDDQFDTYYDSLSGNKIGGEPAFVQGEEFPGDDSWRFFLQLEMMEVPFFVNFGDAGVGYAFVSGDGEEGRFLWHCY